MQDDLTKGAAGIEEAQAELTTARDELQRAQSAHDISHPPIRAFRMCRNASQAWSRNRKWTRFIPAIWWLRRKSPPQNRGITSEQRIRVAQAEQARFKTLYGYAVISAPFTGVITKRYANAGSLIQAGTASQTQAMPVVRLSENGLLRLALPVPESAVPLIHLGAHVDVQVSALNRSFPGRVARFAERIDPSTRTMKTEVDVPNESLILVPGMYAQVDLVTSERKNVLSLPVEAIDGSGADARVFTVQSPGIIHIVPIQLGVETARRIEVRSGSKEGDNVVVGSRSGAQRRSQSRTQSDQPAR